MEMTLRRVFQMGINGSFVHTAGTITGLWLWDVSGQVGTLPQLHVDFISVDAPFTPHATL